MKKIELLAPAGDLERLKIAFLYGADAVYIGGKEFSLRARASNFSLDDIQEAVKIASIYNGKIYVTINIIAHNEDIFDLEVFKNYIKQLQEVGVKGVIVADFGFIEIIKKEALNLEIHISTQLSTLNSEAVKFLEDLNVNRVVLAREATIAEIRKIKEKTNVELEIFIHGGMCMAVSGKCVLSNYLANRDANRGGCAHSCRWYYDVYKNKNKKLNNKKITFSSKDLNAFDYVKELISIGVSSLKVEGRMKSEHYLATVIKSYRMLIDAIINNQEFDYEFFKLELKKAENRPTSTGFLKARAGKEEQTFDSKEEIPSQTFVAKVLDYNSESKMVKIEQRNNFNIHQKFEVFGANRMTTNLKIEMLYDEDNSSKEVARHAKEILYFKSELKLENSDLIRVVK